MLIFFLFEKKKFSSIIIIHLNFEYIFHIEPDLVSAIQLSEQHWKMAKLEEKIGFLGGGNMAFAIGYGLINRGN